MKCNSSITSMLLLSASMLGMSGASFGADNKQGFFNQMLGGGKAPGVAPVENPHYLEECGSCHFPYQPGLLPARSWTKVMAGLEDHFGENAELPAEDAKGLTDYLVKNAADHANYKRSKKIMNSLHPKVGSISKCQACHTKADTGSYSESEILIPGFGGWEEREKSRR